MRLLLTRVEHLRARARERGRLTREEAELLHELLREIQAWGGRPCVDNVDIGRARKRQEL